MDPFAQSEPEHIVTNVRVFLICILLIASTNSWAYEYRANTIGFALNIYNFDYAEYLIPPLKSTEKGVMPGLQFFYYYRPARDSLFHFQSILDLTISSTHYDGATQPVNGNSSAISPFQSTTPESLFNWEADGLINPFLDLSLYTGIGYRVWIRGDGSVVDGVAETQEIYSWWYLPVGFKYEFNLSDTFQIVLDAAVEFHFASSVSVNFSVTNPTYSDSQASLGNIMSYRLKLPINWHFDPSWTAFVIPWYEYSQIGQSPVFNVVQNGQIVDAGFEPNSRTYQYGVLFGASTLF